MSDLIDPTGRRRCDACDYYVQLRGQNNGQCRRHAPRPSPLYPKQQIAGRGIHQAFDWPIVDLDCWCGEYTSS